MAALIGIGFRLNHTISSRTLIGRRLRMKCSTCCRKSARYYYDQGAIKERAVSAHPSGNGFARPQQIVRGGRGNEAQWSPAEKRNRRSVWDVPVRPFKGAHFATFPPDLIEPCILAGCPVGGTVLDPFGGAGTTGLVAQRHGRNAILIELNPEYAAMARERIDAPPPKPKRQRKPANDNATGHIDMLGAADAA